MGQVLILGSGHLVMTDRHHCLVFEHRDDEPILLAAKSTEHPVALLPGRNQNEFLTLSQNGPSRHFRHCSVMTLNPGEQVQVIGVCVMRYNRGVRRHDNLLRPEAAFLPIFELGPGNLDVPANVQITSSALNRTSYSTHFVRGPKTGYTEMNSTGRFNGNTTHERRIGTN